MRVALLVTLLLSNVPAAVACSCLDESPANKARSAKAVFSAEVLKTRDIQIAVPGDSAYSAAGQEAVLRVVKVWKGPLKKDGVVKAQSIVECCMCGMPVMPGQVILVYARSLPIVRLSMCKDSQLFGDNSEVDALDRLRR